jgi:integrase
VVEYQGAPVSRVSNGWREVVKRAGLATNVHELKVTPHTLRHTAISWYLHSGVPPHQVSEFCGVSEQVIKNVYRHHIPGGHDNVLAASTRLGRSATVTQQNGMKQTRTNRDGR